MSAETNSVGGGGHLPESIGSEGKTKTIDFGQRAVAYPALRDLDLSQPLTKESKSQLKRYLAETGGSDIGREDLHRCLSALGVEVKEDFRLHEGTVRSLFKADLIAHREDSSRFALLYKARRMTRSLASWIFKPFSRDIEPVQDGDFSVYSEGCCLRAGGRKFTFPVGKGTPGDRTSPSLPTFPMKGSYKCRDGLASFSVSVTLDKCPKDDTHRAVLEKRLALRKSTPHLQRALHVGEDKDHYLLVEESIRPLSCFDWL